MNMLLIVFVYVCLWMYYFECCICMHCLWIYEYALDCICVVYEYMNVLLIKFVCVWKQHWFWLFESVISFVDVKMVFSLLIYICIVYVCILFVNIWIWFGCIYRYSVCEYMNMFLIVLVLVCLWKVSFVSFLLFMNI
jgi:hypothetical protein